MVLDRKTDKGRTVNASMNAPVLFTLVNDLTKMQINAAVAEADIGSIAERQEVKFTVDAFPNRTFAGSVRMVRNAAGEPEVRQLRVLYQQTAHPVHVAVMVDEPNNGVYYGGDVAAPVFSQVVQQTLRIMNVAPDMDVKAQINAKPVAAEPESI